MMLINSTLESSRHVILKLRPPWTGPINICHNPCFNALLPASHNLASLRNYTHPPAAASRMRRLDWTDGQTSFADTRRVHLELLQQPTTTTTTQWPTTMTLLAAIVRDREMECHKINVKMYTSNLASAFIHVSSSPVRWSLISWRRTYASLADPLRMMNDRFMLILCTFAHIIDRGSESKLTWAGVLALFCGGWYD